MVRIVEDFVVNDDKRLCISVDGSNTTETHCGTGTKVTGIAHDIKTGDFTLKCLVGRCESHTFYLSKVEDLLGSSDFFLIDIKATGVSAASSNGHLIEGSLLVFELDGECSFIADSQCLCL